MVDTITARETLEERLVGMDQATLVACCDHLIWVKEVLKLVKHCAWCVEASQDLPKPFQIAAFSIPSHKNHCGDRT